MKFRAEARTLDKAIRAAGAGTLLYMTWALRDRPEMMRPLSNAYVAAGTYLAACVFYAAMFGKSPEGNAYVAAGLEPGAAQKLQKIAADAANEFYGR